MSFTSQQVRDMGHDPVTGAKLDRIGNLQRPPAGGETGEATYGLPLSVQPRSPVTDEIDLHHEIMAWCDKQYPRVKYIRARSDQRSTIAVGAQDFTLFLPAGRVLCVECKRKDGKLTTEQRAWHKEMEMLGHQVHVVRSMDEMQKTLANLSC